MKKVRKVQVWIFHPRSGQCLLLQTNAARGRFWQPVTGTVEDDEGYFEAACREPLEETSLAFASQPLDSGYEFTYTSRFGPAKERVFALTVADDDAVPPRPILDPKEHDDFRWLAPREALKMLRFPSNSEGLKRTYALVFGKDLSP